MRRLPLFLLVLPFVFFLSGCSQSEVRKETAPRGDLDFYSDSSKQSGAPKEGDRKTTPAPTDTTPTPVPNNVTTKKMYTQPPQMTIDTDKQYVATMKTSAGDIVISLNAKEVPAIVNSFVFLSREKFYDQTIFHRAIKGFMIQGGDPKGDGTGGPGYQLPDEKFTGAYSRGTVAMANSGKNTNGSQFFIMHQDYPLPPNYVIFGKVVSGLEVVDKIAEAPVQPNAFGENSSPVSPVVVQTVTMEEK